MAGERSLLIRLSVRDADVAVAALEKFGARGRSAVQAIENASRPASRGLLALSAAVGQVRSGIDGFAGRAGAIGGVLGAIGPAGLAAAAGIGAAFLAFRQFNTAVTQADALGKFADRIGVSTTALQELRFAAERSGVAAQNLDTGLQRFTRRMAEAAQGTGELKGVLEQYGIAVRNADGSTRKNLDVLDDLADVIAGTTDEAERLRIAVKAFDQEGAGLVNLFRGGAAAVAELRDRASELGLVLDETVIRDAERARDALDTFGKVIEINVNRVLLELAPAASWATEALADFIAFLRSLGGEDEAGRTLEEVRARVAALRTEIKELDQEIASPKATHVSGGIARSRKASLEAELAKLETVLEKARQVRQELAAANLVDPAFGSTGLTADAARRARRSLAELRGEFNEMVKLEAERTEKLKELNERLDELGASEEERVELVGELNRHYDDKVAKIQAATEETKKETEAQKAATKAAEAFADANRTLRERLERLEDAYDRTNGATRDYNETLLDLDLALERGLLTEQEHAEKVAQAEKVYRDATAAAIGYGNAVSRSAQAAAGVPAFDARGLIRSGVDLVAPGPGGAGGGFGGIARSLANLGISRAGNYLLDGVLGGNPVGSLLSNGLSSVVSSVSGLGNTIAASLAQIAPGIGNAIGSFIGINAGLGPAGLLTGGLGPGGAGGAVASQIAGGGLAQAGFAAALPGIGIVVAGLALLASKIFGPGKSSGPALGATFNVDDDRLGVRGVGADNGADRDDARTLADGITDFVNGFLGTLGARLLPGAFAGEVGYESGEYASAISSPGLTDGDRRSGRSPDLRRFGTAEEAVGDFVLRSILDALERGLVSGVSDTTSNVLRVVLERLDRDGGYDAEAVGEALDFAVAFEDTTARMAAAGDAAALQLLELGRAAEATGKAQAETVEAFVESLGKYFGQADRQVAADRIDTSGATVLYDDRNGGETGFTVNGQTFRRRGTGDEGQPFEWVSAAGEIVAGARDAAAAIQIYADQVQAAAGNVTVRDFGDPALLSQGMEAIARYVDDLLGLVPQADAEPLEGFALALEAGLASIEELRAAVEALGLEADQVDAKLGQAKDKLRETLRTDFNDAMSSQIRAIVSPASSVVDALVDNYESLRRQAEAVGGDVRLVDTLFELQVAEAARQEETARINEAIAARDGEIAALDGSTRSLEQLVTSIRQTRENLRVDRALSPLSPTESLAEALRLFEAASADARGGDQEAAGRARDLARTVLELGRDVYASGPQFQTLYNQVDAGLADLEATLGSELSVARSQLDELRAIRANLADTLDGLTASRSSSSSAGGATSLAGLRRLEDGQYTNAAGFDLGRDPAKHIAINQRLIDLGLDPISGFGEGQATARRQADPLVDAVIRSIVGYAGGGDHPGGLRIVGERGPELEATGRSRVYSASQTADILGQAAAGGAEAAGLLAELLAETRAGAAATRDLLAFLRGLVAGRQGSGFNFRAVPS